MSVNQNNKIREWQMKAERFCAYRERCRYEVQEKLKKLGADRSSCEKVIELLEEEGYLDELRFAKLFASGKFRIKRWGHNKIKSELRMKKLSDQIISEALSAIDPHEYDKTIEHLIQKKKNELKGDQSLAAKQKIFRYLLSKGYESGLISKVLNRTR